MIRLMATDGMGWIWRLSANSKFFFKSIETEGKKMLRQKRDGDDVMQCITKACGYGSFICVYIYIHVKMIKLGNECFSST